MKTAWRDSTRRAADIGVDLIELHFAHGYLVNQFLSPLINSRTDDYGGGRENRMRLGLEIFDACRQVFPAERPIGVRISAPTGEGGWDVEDSIVFSKELKRRGCDYICTTSGGVSLKQEINAQPGYQVPLAQAVRQGAGIATMAVGQITEPRQAESILAEQKADMIAIARRLMFNPHWAWSAAAELADPEISGALSQRQSAHWPSDGFSGIGGETAPTPRGHARGGASLAGARLVKLRGAAEPPACLGMWMDLSCGPRRERRSAAPIVARNILISSAGSIRRVEHQSAVRA